MTTNKDHARALRYRELALRQSDKSTAALLNLIADEAERGVLVTSEIHQRPATAQPQKPAPSPYQPFLGS